MAGGNYQSTPRLLSLGCSINSIYTDLLDPTLFHLVCRWGDCVPIQMMLDHDAVTEFGAATLTIRDSAGDTALNWLSTNELMDVVRVVLNRSATNLDAHGQHGLTLASTATLQRDLKLRWLLMERGHLGLNKINNTGRTPLSYVPDATGKSEFCFAIFSGSKASSQPV